MSSFTIASANQRDEEHAGRMIANERITWMECSWKTDTRHRLEDGTGCKTRDEMTLSVNGALGMKVACSEIGVRIGGD